MQWWAVAELAVGVALSIVVGVEREFHGKSAGIRTCALVGLGSALFTVVSRHGNWLLPGMTITNVDGSRVAAQIVSGIGFLGAGLIFVRRDSVRGLTTAASIWLVAAIGMAAGAGKVDLAAAATVMYLLVMVGIQPMRRWLPHSRHTRDTLWITYDDGYGILREVMQVIGDHGISVDNLSVLGADQDEARPGRARVKLEVRTMGGSFTQVIHALSEIPHVREVTSDGHGAYAED